LRHALGRATARTVRKLELRIIDAVSWDQTIFWKPTHLLALLIASMANWLGRHSAAQIDYLKAENRAAVKTRTATYFVC
jgi:hypothetical protein